jgi:hypothetical protein
MNKILMAVVALAFAASLSVQAAGGKANKPAATPETKALRKEMTRKYDLNSDKKLDADELAKVSADDKKKMEEAGIWPKARKANKNKTPEPAK